MTGNRGSANVVAQRNYPVRLTPGYPVMLTPGRAKARSVDLGLGLAVRGPWMPRWCRAAAPPPGPAGPAGRPRWYASAPSGRV